MAGHSRSDRGRFRSRVSDLPACLRRSCHSNDGNVITTVVHSPLRCRQQQVLRVSSTFSVAKTKTTFPVWADFGLGASDKGKAKGDEVVCRLCAKRRTVKLHFVFEGIRTPKSLVLLFRKAESTSEVARSVHLHFKRDI